jgi:hypothetical protein
VPKRDVAMLDRRGDTLAHGTSPRWPPEQNHELPQLSEAALGGDRDLGGSSRRRLTRWQRLRPVCIHAAA